ncbi:MAG: hypothetical protein DMD78_00445 [Candidatus Rokuibacteriota bacterium]|nr:MAG: hypothetical protein DMD78_00445 [Candidatus Rokubacteria bacterium]
MSSVDLVFLGPVLFAAAYWVVAFGCAARYGGSWRGVTTCSPPVTILKPLRGDDGQLYENLASFCRQEYPTFEIVLGVRDRQDPAIAVVDRLIQDFPHVELTLVIDDRTIGTNLKVSNLANLARHAKHDMLIVVDSDMRVGPGYIGAVVGPLAEPRVGLVTCLYRGVAPGGLASRLGAMFINEWFFPAALVGIRIEPLRHAFGATIACRRETLGAIGGFEAVADHLADDYMLGRLVSGLGLRVVLVPYVVDNVITERGVRSLLVHELRWARTFRTLRPLPYFCSLFTFGIPLSLLWFVLSQGGAAAGVATLAHIGLRCLGRLVLSRSLGPHLRWSDTWLVPIRDVLSFLVGIVSFMGRTVQWNEAKLRVRPDGRLEPARGGVNQHALGRAAAPPPLASKWEESP